MTVGTKSILFGVHQFLLHPLLVAVAWTKLYGFPLDPRLWVAFFVHDLGYWGKPNMDGPEGETHVELGAAIMLRFFGPQWRDFCLYHSRFYAKRNGKRFSRLCVADKLVPTLMPTWVYVLLGNASGEIHEYMRLASQAREVGGKYRHMNIYSPDQWQWHRNVCDYLTRWVAEHKDERVDTWTRTDSSSDAAPPPPRPACRGNGGIHA